MKKTEFTLYAYNFRSRAERVLWLLEELQLDYQVIRLNPFSEGVKNPEILKINPQGKMPTLLHKDKVLTDSLAIMEYLVSIGNNPTLIPSNPDDNYRFRNFIYYTLTEVEAYLWVADQAIRLNAIYSWPEGTQTEAVSRVQKSIPHLYSFISDADFSMGDNFTLADIYAQSIFSWSMSLGLKHPSHVMDYLKRIESRPAYPKSII
ncbi:MAG: hypothetical protein GQ569_02540 [Methylococcaceae bacterium]|nr:hypothetical protein [Methylococcaceae bacterium]